ncbi:MAG: hypothetical protein R3C14_07435 [Caldilineaceae bacterium]
MSHAPGRPAKPDGQKRKQLHISLYTEDIDRLDQLTDNRSDFIRQCISEAWTKQQEEAMTFAVTLPHGVMRELFGLVEETLTPEEVMVVQKLVGRLINPGRTN